MPVEFPLSVIGDRDQFEQAVAVHIERLVAFSREVGKPRPTAHPLIEAAIKRISHPRSAKKPDDYAADYVIIDDTPPPPPEAAPLRLDERKNILMASLRAAENAAKEAILPQRKHRLLTLQINASAPKLKPLLDSEGQPVFNKWDDSTLTDEEKAQRAQYEAVFAKYAAIDLAAAQAESDIEDLTDDTVDSWQLPQLG